MRATVWLTVPVLALALAACSPKTPVAPAPPAAPAPPSPPPEPAQPAAAPLAPAPPAEPAAPSAPAEPVRVAAVPPPPFHFSPNDFPRQEHRIAALIANAETRDATGDTHQYDQTAHARRLVCPTKLCVEQSYAAEEAYLRQWEGSADVR